MRIGWIGLGTMGEPMVHNLLKAGHEVTVYNRTVAKAGAVVAAGARLVDSPALATQGNEVVCINVSGPDDVKAVVTGEQGVLAGTAGGTVVIDFSTIGPDATCEVWDACRAIGVAFLSSPVTGSRPAAETGTLTMLVGGDAEARRLAQPVFDAVGQKVIPASTPVEAQTLKLCMNQTFALGVHALVEGLALAEKSGVSALTFLEGMNESLMANPLFALKGDAYLADNFEAIFRLDLMRKDLELGGDMGGKVGAYLPLAAALRELYRGACSAGLGKKDYLATAKFLQRVESE